MDFSLLYDGRDVSACVNLMPCPDGSAALVPACGPAAVAVPDGWRPLHAMSDGRVLLVCGTEIGFAVRGVVSRRVSLDSAPRCCAEAGDVLLVLSGTQCFRFDFDLNPLADAVAAAPAVRAVAVGNIRLDTPAVRLGRTYTAGQRFTAADNRAVAAAVADTVRDIDIRARMAGQLWQPVLCRVRVSDARGNVLFTTEPVLLAHPDSPDFDVAVQLTSDDGQTLNPVAVEAPMWQPQIVWPEDSVPAAAGIATVELLCTPMLYRSDLSKGRVEPRRRADQTWMCSVSFSPLTLGSGSFSGDGLASHLLEIIGRIDRLESIGWSGRAPEAPDARTVPVSRHGDVDADVAVLRRVLAGAVRRVAYDDALQADTARLTAASVTAGGGTVLYADPVMSRAACHNPGHFFARTAAGAWHAWAEVTYADGSTRVSQAVGLDGAPLSFGPLLSVPAPDAVMLRIGVRVAGGIGMTGSYPLVPDPSGRRSVYVAPGARPFALADTSPVFAVPSESPSAVSLRGCLLLAAEAAPQRILCAARPGVGDILAVRAAEAAQSAWDYGRSMFYVFGSRGIHTLKADTGRCGMSASLLDSRVLDAPQALAVTDSGLAASVSGDMVLLRGNSVSMLRRMPGILGLAYAYSCHELWCLMAESTEVLCADRSWGRYTLTHAFDASATVCHAGADALLVAADGSVRLAGHGEPTLSVPVEWCGRTASGRLRRGLAVLRADITGTFSPLAIAVHRCVPGRVCQVPELQLTVTGQLRSAIGRRLFAAPVREAEFCIRGMSSADSIFRSITLSD